MSEGDGGGPTPGGSGNQGDQDLRARLQAAEDGLAEGATARAALLGQNEALTDEVRELQAQAAPTVLAALDAQSSNKVPRWGASSSDFSAEMWIGQVEMLRTVNKWSGEQTREACFLSLEGSAAIWKQAKVLEEGAASLDSFEKFKTEFLKRFKRLRTAAESVQMVSQLKQTSAESCLDFYDRVSYSVHEAHEEDLAGIADAGQKAGYMLAMKLGIRQHFVAGLLTDIKTPLSAKLASLDTKEKLLEAASEIEAAVRPRNAASALLAVRAEAATESTDFKAMRAELDALRARFQTSQSRDSRKKSRRGGQQQQQHRKELSELPGRSRQESYAFSGGESQGTPTMGVLQKMPPVGAPLRQ